MRILTPTPDIIVNAEMMHNDLLVRQRTNVVTILRTYKEYTEGYGLLEEATNQHFLQWKDHLDWLLQIGISCCAEWAKRDRQERMLPKMLMLGKDFVHKPVPPPWWGDEEMMDSHRAWMVRRFPERYKITFPHVHPMLPWKFMGEGNLMVAAVHEVERATKALEEAQANLTTAQNRVKELQGADRTGRERDADQLPGEGV